MPTAQAVAFTPLFDNVLIRRDPTEDKVGHIVMPDGFKEPPKTGTIIACGPGRYARNTGEFIHMVVAPGQRVLFSSIASNEGVKLPGHENEFIVAQDDILGVID